MGVLHREHKMAKGHVKAVEYSINIELAPVANKVPFVTWHFPLRTSSTLRHLSPTMETDEKHLQELLSVLNQIQCHVDSLHNGRREKK